MGNEQPCIDDLRLYTIPETAEVLRVHRSTISRLLSDGELPFVMVRGSKRILESDLRAFIENQIARRNFGSGKHIGGRHG